MTNEETRQCREQIKSLIEVHKGFPSAEKIEGWQVALGDFAYHEIAPVLRKWLGADHMPQPYEVLDDLWKRRHTGVRSYRAQYENADGTLRRYPAQPRRCSSHPWYEAVCRQIEAFTPEEHDRFIVSLAETQAERGHDGEQWDDETATVIAYGAVVTPRQRLDTLKAAGVLPKKAPREWQHDYD